MSASFQFSGDGKKKQGRQERSIKSGKKGDGHGRPDGCRILHFAQHLDQADEGAQHSECRRVGPHFSKHVLNDQMSDFQWIDFRP